LYPDSLARDQTASGLDSPRRSAPERSCVDLAGPTSNDLPGALEHDNLVLAEVTARAVAARSRGARTVAELSLAAEPPPRREQAGRPSAGLSALCPAVRVYRNPRQLVCVVTVGLGQVAERQAQRITRRVLPGRSARVRPL